MTAFIPENAHAWLIDVFQPLDRRARLDQIGGFDLDVGGGEGDLLRSRRLGPDQSDVPDPVVDGAGQRIGARERHVRDRDAQLRGDLGGHVRRDAPRLAVHAAPGDQQKVAEVDRRPQHPGRGELGGGV